MKTKVPPDNSVEGVPSQTTAVTTIANTAQSSVWSICDISTDSHVELRDITPSISPVFTDDQVHELTRNPAEVDVLSEHFLPPDTFKRIDEVLSSGGQTNLLYNDPELSDTLKENHDVLLAGELGFHGTMFPSFDSIVEADRILNKRDEPSPVKSAEGNHSQVGSSDSVNWSKDSEALTKTTGNPEDKNQEDDNKGLRRSPRKRIQVKKDSDVQRKGNLATKSISRGKDISKLKYAKKPEEEKQEVRRSGRAQKKVEKEESNGDKKGKDKVANNKKKNAKEEVETPNESSEPEDSSSKNVRRSPRNQSKATVEGKQKINKKAPRSRQGKEPEESDENKNENSTVREEKESDDKIHNGRETKCDESRSDVQKKRKKTGISEDADSDQEGKSEIRKSGRLTRNREKQVKDKEEKAANEKIKTKAKDIKEKSVEEEQKSKIAGKNEPVIDNKESSKNKDDKDISKGSSFMQKEDKNVSLAKQEKGSDTEEKATRKRKKEVKVEPSESKENENKKSSRRRDRKSKESSEENTEVVAKLETSVKESSEEGMQKTNKRESVVYEGVTKSTEDDESGKKTIKQESTVHNVTDEKTAEDSEQEPRQKDLKKTQDDEESDAVSDSDNNEEFNDDSDYDPEYDPDRLWCICRKPHGNRFMICCDHCEEWFHGMCVGITMAQGRQMEKNGQEYVCPKCKEKIDEESNKDAKPTSEPAEKESEEIVDTSQHVETKEGKPSPTPERHHRRKEHSLKLKIPVHSETRKRRHASHGRSRDEMSEDPSGKKSRESEKLFIKEDSSDERRKKLPEHKGFKIPKKVRTTPTPAFYMRYPTQSNCVAAGCSKLAEYQSVYCSSECVQRHAEESLKIILEEKKKRMGLKSSVHISSSKNLSSPTSSLLGPVPWNSQPAPVSSQTESAQLKEGIAVIERSTGRVIAGMAAPSQEEIVDWLHDHPTFEVLRPSVGKDEKKKEKKEDSEKTVRDNIRKSLKEILTTRSKEQQDLSVTEEDINKCSLNVEREMFSFFGDTGHRYKNKYRSLMFNLKDPRNKVLFRHVLSGEITVDRLVRMTPEQLASPELATWREQETKHTLEMIRMNQEEINATKAHTKKTHKGEVEIDDDDLSTLENSTAELKVEKDLPDSNTSSSTLLLDTTDEHRIHLFDLNCRICTGKMAPPGEPPRRETPAPLVSTTSIVQAVAESSIPSPTPMDIVTSASSPDSAVQPPVSPSVLAKTPKKVPAVWKGFVMMQSVAKFGTSAYRVSGPCDDLLQLLPDTLHVQGRIAHEQVWDYLLQLKSSTSREVCVIRYEASSDDEKLSYVSLYSYFYSRKRCGVVSNCYTGVKDMYLVPLASHQRIPPELLPFDGPGLDDPRPHMLLGVIVRSKVLFKRPRALSQRSLSPPPKRRTSSASVENSSSDGGTVESPTSKRNMLSDLHDSPPADIEDIVFQYNTTQAKITSKEKKDLSTKASPASETSTPSVASSSGAVSSPAVSTDKSSVPSLEAQKQQLLDLQERARQYILAQTQRKETTPVDDAPPAASEEKPKSQVAAANDPQEEKSPGVDDDAPYDPEEDLVLDLNPAEPTPAKPAVSVASEEPSKPSSLQMLVSTLQRLQGAASKSVTPHLAALSSILPLGATTGSKVEANKVNETTAIATSSATSLSSISASSRISSAAPASSILQPIVPLGSGLESMSSDSTTHPTVNTSHGSMLLSAANRKQVPFSSTGPQPHPLGAGNQGPSVVGGVAQHPSSGTVRHSVSSGGYMLQPSGATDRLPLSAGVHRPQVPDMADRQPMSASGGLQQPSGMADRQPMSGSGGLQQPRGATDRPPMSGGIHRPHATGMADHQPISASGDLQQPSGMADRQSFSVADQQSVSVRSNGRMPQREGTTTETPHSTQSSFQGRHFPAPSDKSFQPAPSAQRHQAAPQDSGQTNRWNPSEPPQVTRQVNNVTQQIGQYSGLRPEERARLAAHESRLESRENRRLSSERRDEHHDQRRMNDRERDGWYNNPRYPRDSRPGDSSDQRHPRDSRPSGSFEARNPRDSRSEWRDQHRPGRQWYEDEHRRDRHTHPIDERPRYEERRDERRFKEHWSRDRWRR